MINIILLPGLNGTEGLFKPLIDYAPENYKVVPISYPTQEQLSYEQLQELVTEHLRKIKEPYIIVGESFSGPLSLMIASEKPSGLIGVILVATFVQAPNLKVARFLPWTIGFALTRPLYALRLMFSKGANAMFIKSISMELQKVSPRVLAHRIQSIFSVNVHQELKECEFPLIYFRGTIDFVVPGHNLKLIQKLNPNVKVAKFDTQHFLLQSKSQQAWSEINAFVGSIT